MLSHDAVFSQANSPEGTRSARRTAGLLENRAYMKEGRTRGGQHGYKMGDNATATHLGVAADLLLALLAGVGKFGLVAG